MTIYRNEHGAIIHSPKCLGPIPGHPIWICDADCEYVAPHEFQPQNPDFAPERFARKECHECGLQPDDPVHDPWNDQKLCPRPMNHRPDRFTKADCIAARECGCEPGGHD